MLRNGFLEFDDDFGKDAPRYIPGNEQDKKAQTATITQLSGQIENKTNTQAEVKDRAEVKSDEAKKVKESKAKKWLNFDELLSAVATPTSEFYKRTKWLEYKGTKRFLAKGSINTIFAKSGAKKTFFAVDLALELLELEQIKRVVHFDFDGNTDTLAERNQAERILAFKEKGKWQRIDTARFYEQGFKDLHSFLSIPLNEKWDLGGDFYIFDSLVNFCSKLSEAEAVTKIYQLLRRTTAQGATIWINTHVNKGGEDVNGSYFIEALSNVLYELKANDEANLTTITLTKRKDRDGQANQAFILDTALNLITPIPYEQAQSPSVRNELAKEIKRVLQENGGQLMQGELLSIVGRDRDDKTARAVINELDGVTWQTEKSGREKYIRLL